MDFDFHSWAGKIAGLLALIGFVPYVIATLQGKNKPNRVTWIIWGLVSLILLGSYKTAGATHALWPSVSNALGMIVIIVLSFKYGEGGGNLLDLGCLLTALAGLFFWWFFDSPLPALYISIAVDLIGGIPTIKKSYLDPAREDRLTWILFWTANVLNLFAVEEWNFAMALYPLYLFFISGTILAILTVRRNLKALA